MRHAAHRVPRWAQLTLASVGSGTDRGGPLVTQFSDFAPDRVRQILTAGAETALHSHVDLPLFPSADQLTYQRPHRLVHRPFQGKLSALWHSTCTGLDALGMPGDVFVHAALELGPDTSDPAYRAIDAWRSPIWLTPWGADAVRTSRFEEMDDLPPGKIAGREKAERFLDRPGVRSEALGALVDAVNTTLDGGPNVALIADSIDDGAAWIAVLSHLLPQPAAARLSWSTYERATNVDPLRGFPLNICVFPTVDEDALDELAAFGSRFTLIKVHDPDAPADQTEWILDDDAPAAVATPTVEPVHAAVEIASPVFIPAQPVADDSERMELALVGASAPPDPVDQDDPVVVEPRRSRRAPRSHRRAERRRPQPAAEPRPEPAKHPEPSPVAALQDSPVEPSDEAETDPTPVAQADATQPEPVPVAQPDLAQPEPVPVAQPDLAQTEPMAVPQPDAVHVEPSAPGPKPVPEPARPVAIIAAPRVSIEFLPEAADVGQLWKELRAAKDMSGAAAARYVHIALLDRDCLFERVPAAAPQSIRWEERAWAEMLLARNALLAEAATWHVRHEPVDGAVRVLRLVDFLVRARVASERPDGPPADRVVDLVRIHLPALTGATGPEVQQRCGDLDGRTRFTVLQDAIWASGIPPHTFREPLHLWLGISCWTRYPLR